jgi:hypothetical protein
MPSREAQRGGSITDVGHNLEDDSTAQCGFSDAYHDIVGDSPQVSLLAANGGPTDTLALGFDSPALGAGGACLNPLLPASPRLTVDQRGSPRGAVCDIGAFQSELPSVKVEPVIGGAPQPGSTLVCTQGTWSGDGLAFSFRWRRDGTSIPGAHGPRYPCRRQTSRTTSRARWWPLEPTTHAQRSPGRS